MALPMVPGSVAPLGVAVAGTGLAVATAPDETEETVRTDDVPYHVFLWNDPVTLMDMVVRVLGKVFGYDGPTAEALMLRAHREGKAVVWSGDRAQATQYCIRLGRYGLQSTVAKA